jgi:hypothetical protein
LRRGWERLICRPVPGLVLIPGESHGSRRGLLSFALRAHRTCTSDRLPDQENFDSSAGSAIWWNSPYRYGTGPAQAERRLVWAFGRPYGTCPCLRLTQDGRGRRPGLLSRHPYGMSLEIAHCVIKRAPAIRLATSLRDVSRDCPLRHKAGACDSAGHIPTGCLWRLAHCVIRRVPAIRLATSLRDVSRDCPLRHKAGACDSAGDIPTGCLWRLPIAS